MTVANLKVELAKGGWVTRDDLKKALQGFMPPANVPIRKQLLLAKTSEALGLITSGQKNRLFTALEELENSMGFGADLESIWRKTNK